MDLIDSGAIQEAQQEYLRFLDDKDEKVYYQSVKEMIEKKSTRLIVNIGLYFIQNTCLVIIIR